MQISHCSTTRAVVVFVILCFLVLQNHSVAAPFDRLFVFGDSLSDAGNHLDLIGFPTSPPYFEGRFTNGRVWTDHVADGLGIPKLEPSRLGGTNYAFGGAQSGEGNSTVTVPHLVPNVGPQIDDFISTNEGFLESDLVVLWIGHNDLTGNIPPRTTASNVHTHIQSLYELGGRNFLVADFAGDPNASTLSNLQRARMRDLRQEYSDIDIAEFSFGGLITEMASDPSQFGLTNTRDAACSDCGFGIDPLGPETEFASNPNEYFFWDEIHPTAAVHRYMGERALRTVTRTFEITIGDCNGDNILDVADFACLATLRQRDEVLREVGTVIGDFDGDRKVGFADFLTLAENFGQDGSYSEGNVDLHSGIDFGDFLSLAEHFGWQATAAASVPEPAASSFVLVAMCTFSCLATRRRRH